MCWGYNYSVDNWGNRTNEAASKCSGYNTLTPADTAGNDLSHGLGVYLLGWGIFTTYMFVGSMRVSGAVAAVFLFLAATFIVLAIGAFTMTTADVASASYNSTYKLGGWLGLITAVLAWYASFAAVTNFTFKRTVLPTYPR